MPAPSQVTAGNINTELGVSSTAEIQMSNNWVKNVACKSSGAISYGNCRWGINFPGGSVDGTGYAKQYDQNSTLVDLAYSVGAGTQFATCELTIASNGNMVIYASDMNGTYSHVVNWLTSGAAGDYTAQLQVVSGNSPTGSAANTDLNLGTTRTWTWTVADNSGGGTTTLATDGNLIIKDGGGTLITRPISFSASAAGGL